VLAPCGFSGLRDPAYAGYFERLRELLPKFDALVFHSDTYQDAAFAREAGATNGHLIPNGADEREFGQLPERGQFRERWGIPAETPLVLTVGGHTGLKGHEQAMRAFGECGGAAGGSLAILANHPTGPGCGRRCRYSAAARNLVRRDRRILVADPPRSEVVEAFTDADLFLFCSMVECSPLVLFEAMAAGLPFVSLDVGNAAEIAGWGGGGVIVPSGRDRIGRVTAPTGEVATAVDSLLTDPGRRKEMGASAKTAWQAGFTWDEIAGRYAGLYGELAR